MQHPSRSNLEHDHTFGVEASRSSFARQYGDSYLVLKDGL